ncbi:MAG: dTMP kinase [Planctomycetia bacterium]|nr:dTMP kinase [Planctomycetia bacterium]
MIPYNFSLKEGLLITIEGVDGAGKTTQVQKINNFFSQYGIPVSTFKEPTDGIYGQKIRHLAIHGRHSVTREEEMELFINDRIEDCKTNIIPALKKNHLVILDRYYHSNIAYQGALGLDIKLIRKRNEKIAVKPDLVIILDLAVHIGLSRIIDFRKEEHNHFENEDYLEKVRRIFKKMSGANIQEINASSDEEAVFKNIRNILKNIIMPKITIKQNQVQMFDGTKSKNAAMNILFN